MARRSPWLWLSLVVAGLAAVGVLFFISGGSGDSGRSGAADGAPDPGAEVASADGAAPAKAGVAAVDGANDSKASASANDAIDFKDPVVLRGRLVLPGGEAPKNAAMSVRTGKWDDDFSPTLAQLGGKKAYEQMQRSGELELRMWEIDGPTPAVRAAAKADGTFAVRVPKKWLRFTFEVEAEDGAYAKPEWFQLGTTRVQSEIVLNLSPAGTLEGALVDGAGKPIVGGRVYFSPNREWSEGKPYVASERRVRSNATGRFVVRGVAKGDGNLYAGAEGFGAVQQTVRFDPAKTTPVNVVMPAEARVAGDVVDAAGKGIAGVQLRWMPERKYFQGIGYGLVKTDAAGRFDARGLAAGKHRVTVNAPGMLARGDVPMVDVPLAEGAAGPHLVLEEGRSVSGRVADGNGKAIANARVIVTPWVELEKRKDYAARSRFRFQDATSAADGGFVVRGLGEPPYAVQATVENVGSDAKENVPEGAAPLELVIRGVTGVAGAVLDAESEKPLATFVVTTIRKGDDGEYASVGPSGQRPFLAEDGAFEIDGLRAGQHRVKVDAEGYLTTTQDDVEVKDGEVHRGVAVKLARGCVVRGKVIELAGGAPVSGANVEIERAEAEDENEHGMSFMMRRRGDAQSAADGSFEIAGVKPGFVKVRAWEEGLLEAVSARIEIGAGAPNVVPALSLGRGGSIEGVVLGDGDKPIAGATVTSYPVDFQLMRNMRHSMKNATTDAEGRFRLDGVAPGMWNVTAQTEARTSGILAMSRKQLQAKVEVAEGATAQVQLMAPRGGCTVKGRVTQGGKPLASVHVSIHPEQRDEASAQGEYRSFDGQTSDDGTFVIENVPSGDATLTGFAFDRSGGESNASFTIKVSIPNAPEHRIDVQAPIGGAIAGRVVRRSDGQPVAGVSVQVNAIEPSEGTGDVRSGWGNVTTGPDGRFTLRGLTPGKYQATAGERFGQHDKTESAQLAAQTKGPIEVRDGATANVEFSLESGATVVVEVLDAAGQPSANTWVTLMRSGDPNDSAGSWDSTNARGVATITGIAPGTYVASATVQGQPTAYSEEFQVQMGREARVRVQMVPGVPIRIRAAGPDGAEIAIGSVQFIDARSRPAFFDYREPGDATKAAWVDASVAPGKYTVHVDAAGFAHAQQEVAVGTDPSQSVTVKLEKPAEAKKKE